MKHPRTLLIVNPRASRVTAATGDLIVHALASVTKLERVATEHAGHARTLARDAAAAGAELVVALGGDGTVNEVANGLIDAGPSAAAALAVVPSGGVDVFARTIGLPHDTIEAADALVRFLDAGDDPVLRAVGMLDDRAFLFNAGLGFDAAIVEAVDRHPRRKRRYGDAYFAFQGFKVFWRSYPRRDAVVTAQGVTRDGAPARAEGKTAIVCLSDPYTYLGSRRVRLCPQADPAAGLSVLVLDAMPTLRTLRILARSFRGKHGRIRGVQILDGLGTLEVTAAPPLASQTDGEQTGIRSRVSIRYLPDAIRVCLPRG
jgi:diacylglycerol kinase family enzyme